MNKMNFSPKGRIVRIKSTIIFTVGIFLLQSINCIAQKGATPIFPISQLPTANGQLKTSTYAVVVGISDYQSPQIPDLQYADRDARAFANWLRSPAGGQVKEENIILLVNDSATTARFMEALNWLMEQTKEGDQAIIYFSGHGDVETKLRDQLGFLLCYDSPARIYGAGACPVNYLQSVISTISLDKKGKVMMIADACHAGKLAGSKINGSGITNANLAQQFANEVKILSCQQNEFSLEGREWGNGRGVFSWVLIDGLNGMADANEDKSVSLMEIGRYLEERVPSLTAPHQQIPITVGDRMAGVAKVDENYKNEIQKAKSKETIAFVLTNMRGLESAYLANSDSSVQKKYKQFLAAIESHKLMSPKDSCANDLYESLKKEKSLEPLINLMRRNLAIVLQDEVQQALNALLDDDPYEFNKWYNYPEKYSQYPVYLERAIELLGLKHYAFKSLSSKKLFFEAYLIRRNVRADNARRSVIDSFDNVVKSKLFKAVNLDSNAAYLYNAIADLYADKIPCKSDSVQYWNERASEFAPTWLSPLLEIGYEFNLCQENGCKAEPWIEKAYNVRPDSYLAEEKLSWLRQWQYRSEDSKKISLAMIKQKPELFNAYSTLAKTLFQMDGDFKQAEIYARKAIALEAKASFAQWALGKSLIATGKYKQTIQLANSIDFRNNCNECLAEAYFYQKKYNISLAILDSFFVMHQDEIPAVHLNMLQGKVFFEQGKIQKAKQAFMKILEVLKQHWSTNSAYIGTYAWLAQCYFIEKNYSMADSLFHKAINYRFCGDGLDGPPFIEEAHYLYALFLMNQNRMPEAKEQLIKSIDARRMGYWGEYGMAIYLAKINLNDEALNYLQKALENLFPFYDKIMEETAFKELRNSPLFKNIKIRYFPETQK